MAVPSDLAIPKACSLFAKCPIMIAWEANVSMSLATSAVTVSISTCIADVATKQPWT